MPWSSSLPRLTEIGARTRSVLYLASCAALLWLGFVAGSRAASDSLGEKLSIYSKAANYSLPIEQRNGQDYVGLLELLDPLGTVSATADHSHWRLHFYQEELEFNDKKSKVKMHGGDLTLSADFLLENGRGLVPVSSLSMMLPRILGGPVEFHQAARRLFIGDVQVHFTAAVNSATPPSLVMNFSSPVNTTITTEPGKTRIVFAREGVVAPASPLTFSSTVIRSASFTENNGAAELAVNTASALTTSVSADRKTITLTPVAQVAQVLPPPPPPAPVYGARRYFAVVDASHGGSERGAALNDDLAEKDITLIYARRIRQELEARGISTLLVRDGDMTLTLDQRANAANLAHPAIYIAVHAASQGIGVRVYTALLPAGNASVGPFVNWNVAQSGYEQMSRDAASQITAQFQAKQVPVKMMTAALRPLNNIRAAAIAVEVAPQGDDVSGLTSVTYQQLVAYLVAAGVAADRTKLEASK